MVQGRKDEEIPYFIKVRGCINCDASKRLKEKTGKDYGFDHEIMVRCLLLGCQTYGVALVSPFIDPEEVVRFARENAAKGKPEALNIASKYVTKAKEAYGQFYERIGVSLDKILSEL